MKFIISIITFHHRDYCVRRRPFCMYKCDSGELVENGTNLICRSALGAKNGLSHVLR